MEPDLSLHFKEESKNIQQSVREGYTHKNVFPRLVSMEMAAIFDFRALTKVHITSKQLLQMQ